MVIMVMNMELVSLKEVSLNTKLALLKELGFDSDEDYVFDLEGKIVVDRYIGVPVRVNNMVIFPGSAIILDDNELSISSYFEEFGDVF